MQHKRRALQDLETELRNKARKQAEQHARLEQGTEMTRTEYYALKDELDRLAYTLRFSVEEELKIYEALLNSLHRKTDVRPATNEYNYRQTEKSSSFVDTMSIGAESTGFRRSQPNLSETTRVLTTQTHTDDTARYPPPSFLTQTSRTFVRTSTPEDVVKFRSTPLLAEETRTTTTKTTKTTKQPTDTPIPVARVEPVETRALLHAPY